MAAMNETRVTHTIGVCPACQNALEIVLRVELGDAKVVDLPGGRAAVTFEFGQPQATGAVLKPHDCMKRPGESQPRGPVLQAPPYGAARAF